MKKSLETCSAAQAATQPQHASAAEGLVADSKARNPTAFCAGCSRFIGTADVCPFCGCDSARPPVLRVLRRTAVALALLGLFFVYLAVWHDKPDRIDINMITPAMNHAYILVTGRVDRAAYVVRRKGWIDYLSFVVRDETGQIRVAASREVARELDTMGGIPNAGDAVSVTGTLQVEAGSLSRVRLRDADGLTFVEVPSGENDARMEEDGNRDASWQ